MVQAQFGLCRALLLCVLGKVTLPLERLGPASSPSRQQKEGVCPAAATATGWLSALYLRASK